MAHNMCKMLNTCNAQNLPNCFVRGEDVLAIPISNRSETSKKTRNSVRSCEGTKQ